MRYETLIMKHFYSFVQSNSGRARHAIDEPTSSSRATSLNLRKWNVSEKSSTLFAMLIVMALCSTLDAQENSTGNLESELSLIRQIYPLQKVSDKVSNADLAVLELKMNERLAEVNKLLTSPNTRFRFQQGVAAKIFTKAQQACPSVPLEDLIASDHPYNAPENANKQELYIAIELLAVVINELKAQ
jgi:uncharacterized lipoprotein YehR (DUF1307 family)